MTFQDYFQQVKDRFLDADISQVADRYVKHPSEVVSVGDVVQVTVLDVDEKKKRISLSMRQAPKA